MCVCVCVCVCTERVVCSVVMWVEWGCIFVNVSMYGASGRWSGSVVGVGMYLCEYVYVLDRW